MKWVVLSVLGLVTQWAFADEIFDPLETAYQKCRALQESPSSSVGCQLKQTGAGEFLLYVIATSQAELAKAKDTGRQITELACTGNTVKLTVGFMLTTTTAQVMQGTCLPPGSDIHDVTDWRVVSVQ